LRAIRNVTRQSPVCPALRRVMAASDYVDIDEGSAIAGVSVSTFRYWIYCGRLESVRPGRRRMVRRDVLETFLASDITAKRRSRVTPRVKQSRR
jgi:excisionase family DNA binding protein